MRNSTFNKDTDIKEYRRRLIVRLSENTDLSQIEISQIVECTQGYVSQILTAYKGGGVSELASGRHLGAKSGLNSSALKTLKSTLDKGAKFQGYADDL